MTDQISTLHLKQNKCEVRICLLSFSFTCLIEIPRTRVLLHVNYLCECHLKRHTIKKIQDKQLHAEKRVKILLRVPELVDNFAD